MICSQLVWNYFRPVDRSLLSCSLEIDAFEFTFFFFFFRIESIIICVCDWCTSLRHSNSWLITFNIYHGSIYIYFFRHSFNFFFLVQFVTFLRVYALWIWLGWAHKCAYYERHKSTGTILCCHLFIYLRNRNIRDRPLDLCNRFIFHFVWSLFENGSYNNFAKLFQGFQQHTSLCMIFWFWE